MISGRNVVHVKCMPLGCRFLRSLVVASYVSCFMATPKVNGDRDYDAISKSKPRKNLIYRHDDVNGAKLKVKNRCAMKGNATEDENSSEKSSGQHHNCSS